VNPYPTCVSTLRQHDFVDGTIDHLLVEGEIVPLFSVKVDSDVHAIPELTSDRVPTTLVAPLVPPVNELALTPAE